MNPARLVGCVVLVVEDEPLVGLDIVAMLSAAGAHVVSATTIREAMVCVDRFKISAAVLDINLGDHDCAVVCQLLSERRIPFLFYTGYGHPLDGWSHVPVVKKPALPRAMIEAVERLCGSQQQVA